MKYLIGALLAIVLTLNIAHASSACGEDAKAGSDCEVVRTVTRCDLAKQKLRNRIAVLERQLKRLDSAYKTVINEYNHQHQDPVVVTEVVEKETVKHSILSLYTVRDVQDLSVSQSNGTATATLQTQFEPGIKYQYQFNFGLVPEIGIDIKGNPLFGLGWEF